jgi:hypothetical protein
MPADPQPISLGYGHAAAGSRWRRTIRRVGPLILLLAVVGWAATHFGRSALLFVGQIRAVATKTPADLVVIRQDEDLSFESRQSDGRSFRLSFGAPQTWFDFVHKDGIPGAPVFIGERDAGRGSRIVCVYYVGNYSSPVANPEGTLRWCLGVRVFRPATVFSPPTPSGPATATVVLLPGESPLRVYAGQASPSDSSHFAIGCATGDGRGSAETLDCTLNGDDTVQIIPRLGIAKLGLGRAY